MSQNQTLIGCLGKAGQDWHLKISFYKGFFLTKNINSPWQISVAETLQDPPGTHFFPDPPPFLKFWIEGCPPAESGGWGGGADTV